MKRTDAPHSAETEASVLGSIMLGEGDPMLEVAQIIDDATDFYIAQNATVYRAMCRLVSSGGVCDIASVKNQLADDGDLDRIGGVEYLVTLCEHVASSVGADYYAKQVRGYARHRAAIVAVGKSLEELQQHGVDIDDCLRRCEQSVFALTEFGRTNAARYLRDILDEQVERWTAEPGEVEAAKTIATGFYELDAMLAGGLHCGELMILAARPSMGKSGLMMDFAERASRDKNPALVFSAEMSDAMIAQRLVSKHSDVPSHALRSLKLHADDKALVRDTAKQLGQLPILIDDTPSPGIVEICGKARRLASTDSIGVVFVDYLQLLTNRMESRSREQEVAEMSRMLKALARELKIPVVCLAQLNRGPEARDGGRPKMSDLRDSGQIEQDADAVLLLYRADQHFKGHPNHQDDNIAEVIIAKQRNGATGVVKLVFDGPRTTFKNLQSYATEGAYQ